jgi:hypoxanthine phosphoribosyltransferase
MPFENKLEVVIERDKIAATVEQLAADISKNYCDKQPVLISVLKGSFIFLADLIRRLDFPLEVEFITLSSYNRGKESSGRIEVVQGLCCSIEDRYVLVVEDIIDTGLTTSFLLDYLSKKKPASIKVCALTSKPSRWDLLSQTCFL